MSRLCTDAQELAFLIEDLEMEGLAIAFLRLIVVLSPANSITFVLELLLTGLVHESVIHKWHDVKFGKGIK